MTPGLPVLLTPRFRRLVPAAVLLASAACVQTRTRQLGEQVYPPRPADHPIVLYDRLDDVERPFVKVARLRGRGGLWGDDVLESLEAEARRLGADALVLAPQVRCCDECDGDDREAALAVRWR